MDKLKYYLELSGFDECPEQPATLQFALDLTNNGVGRSDICAAIHKILAEAGETAEMRFDEDEKPRW